MSDVTRILDRVQQGESKAADELLPLVYDELRRIVAHKMAQEAPGHTLQPTAPVPEAWLRLVGDGNPQFEGRAHFFAVAAEAMRRILAEAARRKRSLKRGAGASVTDHGSSPVRPTRREFVRWLAAGLCLPWALEEEAISEAALRSPALLAQAATTSAASLAPRTKSDVGSLWPFIQSQAVKGEFPLSWLQPEFKRLETWKRKARGRLLELLHYSPPRCEPRAEVVERVDAGDYVREKVYFNTTPDIRVPAFVLVPKKAKFPAPGIVALHDHGGFYFWGKEKIVESEIEHAVLTDFKKSYYGGKSIASELARQGYVVVVIDMFYWGERRMLLDDDPADWRDRPRDITAERIAEFNRRAGQSEQLVGRTIYSAGFTWPGVMFWDDIRTVDYLLTRPEVDKRRIGCVGLSVGGLRSCHLAALDDRVREDGENPSIGIILCKEKRRTIVEYALRAAGKPIGVATYRTVKHLPKELKGQLPAPEDIIKLLEGT